MGPAGIFSLLYRRHPAGIFIFVTPQHAARRPCPNRPSNSSASAVNLSPALSLPLCVLCGQSFPRGANLRSITALMSSIEYPARAIFSPCTAISRHIWQSSPWRSRKQSRLFWWACVK